MCNKRSFIIKNNYIRCIRAFLTVLVLIFLSSCKTGQVEEGASDPNTLHNHALYHAIEKRDFSALWDLKDHVDPSVSEMALRAMIHANEIPVDLLFEETLSSGNPALWRVLSHQSPDLHQLAILNRELSMKNLYLPGLCEAVARQGNRESLRILSENPELIRNEERCSYAAGNLLSSVPVEEKVAEKLFSVLNADRDASSVTVTNLLYGLYRSDLNRPDPGSELFVQLADYLRQRRGNLTLADEYLIRITAPVSVEIVLNNRSNKLVQNNIQVSVELAAALSQSERESIRLEYVKFLADHPNPHVRIQLLESLNRIEGVPQSIHQFIAENEPVFKSHSETRLAYLMFLKNNGEEISGNENELAEMLVSDPYFGDQIFELLSGISDHQSYLELLITSLDQEGVLALHASSALNRYVQGRALSGDEASAIRRALMNAVESGNRSVVAGGRELYLDIRFMNEAIGEKISEAYGEIASDPDTGLASALYSILQETNYAVQFTEPVRKPFRRPDRFFLADDVPLWVLETEHGDIVIELDPNTAPYTVSSIIHLTEAGAYDDVVMHRVVRNFVIQGGDFDRKDGFGGPEYRIPTEPGIRTFLKGSVGIASSGLDTEGSQFFITLTPTPHLDGNYTNFGKVRSGMEIAESIQKGDRILRATIE